MSCCNKSILVDHVGRRQKHGVLVLSASELEGVAISKLDVTTGLDTLPVQLSAVHAVQVDQVWLDLFQQIAILVFLGSIPELYNSVLFAGALGL